MKLRLQIPLQIPRNVRPMSQRVEDGRQMISVEKDVFSMEGKEGRRRHCLYKGKVICMELVRVDSTSLLWAELLDPEQMAAIEKNKELLVIPLAPLSPPPLRDNLQTAQVDFDLTK